MFVTCGNLEDASDMRTTWNVLCMSLGGRYITRALLLT